MFTISKLKEAALDILFPPICCSCRQLLASPEKNAGFCKDCAEKIQIHTTLFCAECRNRLPDNKKVCHRDANFILAAITDYLGPARDLIHYFKFRSWSRLRDPISDLMAIYFRKLRELKEKQFSRYVIIPVPLHPDREQERGFNQAKLIAEIAASYLHLPLEENLIRIKNTSSQTGLKNWDLRRQNIADAFAVKNPDACRGQNIILVDDVFTSGSTIREAIKTLRSAGARKIIALVFAKTR